MGKGEASHRERHPAPVTRILRNLKAAREEFAAAVSWYEQQRPGLGGEFFDAVVMHRQTAGHRAMQPAQVADHPR
jgi:hypothetical protein